MDSSVPEETSKLSPREVCQNANNRVTSGCGPKKLANILGAHLGISIDELEISRAKEMLTNIFFKYSVTNTTPNDHIPGELSVAVPVAVILKDSILNETA